MGSKNILLVGGGGYIGPMIAEVLLQNGYNVKCLESFIYKNHFSIKSLLKYPNYELIEADFRNIDLMQNAFKNVSDIIILAGLVGDPITKKYPKLSSEINDKGIKNFIDLLDKFCLDKLIFVSTCSNYGVAPNNVAVDENYPVNPVSEYAKAKVSIENYLLSKDNLNYNPVILRFATAFGLAPRMRFDLTVNEFILTLGCKKELVVFDAETWRPYCHVKDFAKMIQLVIEAPNNVVSRQIFNVGSNNMNYTKRQLTELIRDFLPNSMVKFTSGNADSRNYMVNFDKVAKILGFVPSFTIRDGIIEILTMIDYGYFKSSDLYNNHFGNYEIFIND